MAENRASLCCVKRKEILNLCNSTSFTAVWAQIKKEKRKKNGEVLCGDVGSVGAFEPLKR